MCKNNWILLASHRRRVLNSNVLLFSGLCSTLLLLAGCGGVDDGYGRVTGVVKLDGEPLPKASVEFTPVNGVGMTSYGRTDSSGAYDMMATDDKMGAAVGVNKVRISTYDVIDSSRSVPEKVPMKYNVMTELESDVKSGSNTFDFDLSSEGGRIQNRKNDLSNQ
jgi:hypothetical protein